MKKLSLKSVLKEIKPIDVDRLDDVSPEEEEMRKWWDKQRNTRNPKYAGLGWEKKENLPDDLQMQELEDKKQAVQETWDAFTKFAGRLENLAKVAGKNHLKFVIQLIYPFQSELSKAIMKLDKELGQER